jgi:hypothetical protein
LGRFVWLRRARTRISSVLDLHPAGGSSPASRVRMPLVPYLIEEGQVHVYDPNYPCDRGRFVEFLRNGAEFVYDGFRSRERWGITLVSISACFDRRRNVSTPNRVEWTRTSRRAQTGVGATNGRG